VLKTHAAVEDALVFGRPDERFGSRVAGIVSLSPGATASAQDVIDDSKLRLASFKVPKELLIVDLVPRAPNGKANYPEAQVLFDHREGTDKS